MNRIYRLVFNRELGLVQVASELTSSARGGAGSAEGARTATLPVLRFAMYVALGFVMTLPAFAQAVDGWIIGDPNVPGAQRPTVLSVGNGVPVVNIATPSAQGVSRNSYSQFDVGRHGAVLNNSRLGATTQLGGAISGNPNLARGTARVILNEVNGPASQLNGYVEVGGDRAQVVIANPAGIRANGGGFLNASRVTLTTGTPILNGGSLDGYRVEGGAIQVDGTGLDTSRSDYTDLIARSMQLNAGVWAQQLQTTLGANAISVDPAKVTKIEGVAGPVPQFALDASALGGMYANKIVLLGTEHGVGVRNAGTIGAQAGDLLVTVDGRLDNTGKLQSKANTHLDARAGVANAGALSAARELIVTTPANIDSSGGTLNARRIQIDAVALRNHGGSIQQTGSQALSLQSGTLSNRDGGRIGMAASGSGTGTGNPGTGGDNAGGADPNSGSGSGGQDGRGATGGGTLPLPEPLADGVLRIAGALSNDGGAINAGGGVSVATVNGLDNSGGRLGLRNLTLTQGNLRNAGGELKVAGNANLHVGQINNDAGRFDIAGSLQVDAYTLRNRRGTLTQGGSGASSIRLADSFDNTDGTFATNASALTLGSGVLVNERGRVDHAGANGLTMQAGTLNGAAGRIVTAGAAILRVDAIDHRGATLGAAQITLDANAVDNRGGRIAASGPTANALTVRDTLSNGGSGMIASQGDLVIRAATLGNTGGTVQQAGTGTLSIDATTLNGAGGTLGSNGAISITGITTDLRRGATAARSITVDTGTLVTAGGTLTAAGTDPLAITARNRLDNTAGKIASNGALQLNAGALANADGTIGAAGKKIVNVGAGTADTDAVNVKQLKDTGIIDPTTGQPQKAVLFNGPNGEANVAGQKIINVADGTVSATSKDAVNGSQLFATNQTVNNINNGGGIKYFHANSTLADSLVGGSESIAVGGGASSGGTRAISIGANATASATDSVALGGNSIADRVNSVSVGSGTNQRQIINLARGTADTDGVNVSQLKGVTTVIGGGAGLNPDGTVKAPSISVGGNTYNNVTDAITAIDIEAGTGNPLSVVYDDAKKEAVTLNKGGAPVTVSNVKGGIADTDAVNVKQLKDTGIIDPTTGQPQKAVLFNGPNGEANVAGQKIVNVGAGTANTDGVNVSQLKGVTTVIGGGSGLNPDGTVKAPSISVGGNTYNNVTEAITNVDGRTIINTTNIKNLLDGKAGLVQQAAAGQKLTVGKDTDGTEVNFTGTAGDRKLSGVSKGTADTDAVNVSQLKGLIDPTTGEARKAVLFDGPNGEANVAGKKIVNVGAGTADTDAVNVKQLKDTGIIDPTTGQPQKAVLFNGPNGEANVAGQKIVNVADGGVSAASKDAINGSQLFATSQSVANSLGGGAKVNPNGTVANPAYTVHKADGTTTTVNNVGDALDNVDGRITNITTSINNGGVGLVQQAAKGQELTVGKNTDGAKVNFTGTAGDRELTGVAKGTADTSAVNVSQLKTVVGGLGGGSKIGPDGTVIGPTYKLSTINNTFNEYNTVGDAITNLDERATYNTTNIKNVLDGKAGLVQQAAPGQKLTVGKDTDGTEVNFTGTAGDRKLTGVAKGTADNDAVNVSQLKDAGLVNPDGKVANVVTYDSPDKTSVTLGGAGATQPVKVKNVANATADDEAVNLGQLKGTGLVTPEGKTLEAVVYDAGSNKASVTFGGANGTVLNNVAAGRIEAGSRQAVNGGQIASLRDQLQGQITNIDGRVTNIEQNGTSGGKPDFVTAKGPGSSLVAPKPANASDSGVALGYDSVAAGNGASAVGDHASANAANGTAVGSNARVEEAASNSVALGSGSVADRANTVSVGSAGQTRAITNVAAGTADHDAVNVAQLNQRLADANQYTDERVNDVWNDLSNEIDEANTQANRGIAAASALINVTPYLPGRTAVNAGVASYRGETALGVGVSRWSDNGRVNFNAGVSAAQGDEPVFRVGVGYVF